MSLELSSSASFPSIHSFILPSSLLTRDYEDGTHSDNSSSNNVVRRALDGTTHSANDNVEAWSLNNSNSECLFATAMPLNNHNQSSLFFSAALLNQIVNV